MFLYSEIYHSAGISLRWEIPLLRDVSPYVNGLLGSSFSENRMVSITLRCSKKRLLRNYTQNSVRKSFFFWTSKSAVFPGNFVKIFRTIVLCINQFHATGPFLYSLKTLENFWFSDLFRGYRKGLMEITQLLKSFCLNLWIHLNFVEATTRGVLWKSCS